MMSKQKSIRLITEAEKETISSLMIWRYEIIIFANPKREDLISLPKSEDNPQNMMMGTKSWRRRRKEEEEIRSETRMSKWRQETVGPLSENSKSNKR